MTDLKHYFKDAAQNHLFGETELLPEIELALVFGSKKIINELATMVAHDFHQGLFSKILVVGGIHTEDGKIESDAIADILIHKYNVPEHAILRETESRNTLENAVNALEVMKTELGDDHPPYSMIGYGQAYAGMRFLWTMNKVFPSSILMFKQVFPENFNAENALLSDVFRESCKQQLSRLNFYARAHYISPVTLAEINQRIQGAHPAQMAA